MNDKDLLDFLDGLAERYNPAEVDGWIMRDSLMGRGARLHMTTRKEMDWLEIEVPIHQTAREAIAHFMRSIGANAKEDI